MKNFKLLKNIFTLTLLLVSASVMLESQVVFAATKIVVKAQHSNPLAKGMDEIIGYGSKGMGSENNAFFLYTKLRCKARAGALYTCPRRFSKQMRFLYKGISWNKKNGTYELALYRSKFPKTFFTSFKKSDPRLTSPILKIVLGAPKISSKPNQKFKARKGVKLYVSNIRKFMKVESRIEIDFGKLSKNDVIAAVKIPPKKPDPWPPVKRPPWGKKPPWALNPFDSPVHEGSHISQIRFR